MSTWPAIADIAVAVQKGQLKAVDTVKQSLSEISNNKEYDAIISVVEDRALRRAKEIDLKVAKGQKVGKLAGVPFIAKDNFMILGGRTTAASKMLEYFEAPYQATAIERLEAEGAICVAKSNLDAWAHGSSTENSDFFVTKNPHDKTRVPGGSSGGSAASVALGLVPFALGTDTGGSVRLPASFCGVVGFKPTYGLISRSGIVAMASSTDVVGSLTRDVNDAAIVLDVMSGKDDMDSTTIEEDTGGYRLEVTGYSLKAKKIGVIKEYMTEGLQKGVESVVQSAIEKLKKAGAEVSEISLPSLPLALAVYYIICPAEVSSNLARYDGQRYGYSYRTAPACRHAKRDAPPILKAHRGVEASGTPSSYSSHDSVRSSASPSAASLCERCRAELEDLSLEDDYYLSREQGFGAEAKRRIMIGAHVLSSGYYDAYYKKAQTVRTKIINELQQALTKYDFLIGPTAATTAFKIGAKSGDPLQMYLTDILAVAANITGVPSISIPVGLAGGLPVGLQIMARQKADRELLAVARAFEELT